MGTKDNRTKDHVMTRVGDSQATYKGQNIVFRQLNRYYLSLSPPVEVRDNDRAIITGRQEDVDLFVPITFSIIESAVPLFLFSQFGHVPYLDVQGRTQDDDEKKDAVRNMLDYASRFRSRSRCSSTERGLGRSPTSTTPGWYGSGSSGRFRPGSIF
jgi:hypothetical protein